jgi:O-antigen ligase
MANAIILVLALAPSWLWRIAALVPLVIGLGFTQSRGSIVAAGVGVIVILMLRGLGSWRRTVAAIVALAVVVVAGFQLLPEEVQARTTDFSTGDEAASLGDLSASEYTVRLREIYQEQGWELVNAHPVFGVGPDNYRTGVPGSVEEVFDPHNVIIRTAGEVGYPGLIGFGILVVGSALLVFRRRDVNPYAVVAVAVQAAIIAHGFVDVYWVRGTPVLGWLLIGMAMNRRLDQPRERPDRDRRGVSQRRPSRSLPLLTPPRPAGVGDR